MSPRSHRSACDRRTAFTLIEVAMAAAILALVIATAITAWRRAFIELDAATNLETANGYLR